jgi:hypothetical protein
MRSALQNVALTPGNVVPVADRILGLRAKTYAVLGSYDINSRVGKNSNQIILAFVLSS